MSREEHLTELVRQGQALRQEDIDLGAKQERERIIKLLDDVVAKWDFITDGEPRGDSHYWLGLVSDALKYQIKEEK